MIRYRVLALALAISISISIPLPALFAESPSLLVGALKGPSGIGLIRLFESPPASGDAPIFKPVAVASVELMTAKIISGEYGAGVLPVNVAAKLRASGIPIRLAAVVGEGMLSFLSADRSIHSLADLRGKRIALAGQGATPDYLFRRLLRGARLDPAKDLRLDYSLPYPEAAAALAAGEIAYAVLPEPFSTMARQRNPRLEERLDLGALWKAETGQDSYPMTCLVVSSALADRRPELVRTLLAASADSIAWVASHPAEAGALVERHDLGLKAAVAAAAIPRCAFAFKDARSARPGIEALLDAFIELAPASVGGRLPDDGFYLAF
jgi:NitT/TauT family transport system substrate-binding protein